MSTDVQPTVGQEIVYPESDGQPMADNTLQFRWIVTIEGGLDALFAERPDVFVAGDLLWYPLEGHPEICRAPDALVVFGRPKGYRGSYLQWQEDGIAPQVVFEVLSPNNSLAEIGRKFEFYDLYGVEEYYLYDPEANDLTGWQRRDGRLRVIAHMDGWVSPRLGIRFDASTGDLKLYRPDGEPFLSYVELEQEAREARQQARQAEQQARQAEQRAEQLAARLRELGIDPDG
jgi:Uma2 family endonuclease